MSNNPEQNQHNKNEEEEEEEEEKTFEEIGLDARLIRALTKKDISIPTPIQRVAIPFILEGKDVVAQAKTGSGKTFAYILPMLQKLFSDSSSTVNKTAPVAFVLVPTRELSQQVYAEILSIIEICRVQLKVVQMTSGMSMSDMQAALAGPPDILVSTPACISTCISKNVLSAKSIGESLSILVLDEADLLLSYGYLNDLETLSSHVPRRCQCLLMSATLSADVEKLKKLVLHNPVSLTLTEVGDNKDEIIPNSVQQFWISCSARDKLLHLYALLKLDLVQKKVLIFVNAIDTGFKLKLFLEQFGIRSAVLNAELPQNSRLHILEEFNAGLFDYLIATDDGQTTKEDNAKKENDEAPKKSKRHLKRKLDSEFGVVRGIDFKNVYTVINFDMPENTAGYVHRIGRTGRAYNTGASVSLVSSDEMEVFEDIKTTLGDDSSSSSFIAPFPLLTQNAVESLRYRAEDVGKSITKVAIRESRAQDLRNEILNSEKLKAHFEVNPKDLDLLKHDRVLSKKLPPDHLRAVPEYLLDATTKEATKIIKLARAAMGNNNNKSSRRQGSGKRLKKSRDPLKTFSADAPKRMRKGGVKRDREEKTDGNRKSKKKATVAN